MLLRYWRIPEKLPANEQPKLSEATRRPRTSVGVTLNSNSWCGPFTPFEHVNDPIVASFT